MSTTITDEFLSTLPEGPLIQYIGQLHAILVYGRVGNDPNVFAIAEHSLRQIARYSQADETARYYESAEYHAEKQRERMMAAVIKPPSLAGFGEAMRSGIKNMADTVAKMRERNELSGLNERLRTRDYRSRLAHEKELGLNFVQAEARRVRKELGLPIDNTRRSK